jgi:Tol biopolymer transport system component
MVPSWSHDGLWIYFTSDRSGQFEIWKTPKDGGEAVQVTRSGGYGALESPGGEYLYYAKFTQPGLFRMPPHGGEEAQVLPILPAGGMNFRRFTVTSKGVYFFSDAKTIRFLDAATGKIGDIATLSDPNSSNSGFCVSPDDAYVLYAQIDRNSEDLMLVDGFR